ncbi:helicase associated domain-containing protein [Ekhidna sp.]|uniref:helicase associated domain-containing protein n=1 Tax=Ekhidna sp. TaxID=2608089 RepID=UPI003BAACA5A
MKTLLTVLATCICLFGQTQQIVQSPGLPDNALEGQTYTYTYNVPIVPSGLWTIEPATPIDYVTNDGMTMTVTWPQAGLYTVIVHGMNGPEASLAVLVSSGGSTPPTNDPAPQWTEENNEIHYLGNVGIGKTNPETELDVAGVISATGGNSTTWNTAFGWGDHSLEGYYKSGSSPTFGLITTPSSNSVNWEEAYSWGDHSLADYYKTGDNPNFGTTTTRALTIGNAKVNGTANRPGLLEITKAANQSWSGISIEHTTSSAWSLMGDQDDFGIYDDQNNEWALKYNENSSMDLYYNGTKRFGTTSNGISVSGTVYATGGNSTEWNSAYKPGDSPSFENITSTGDISTSGSISTGSNGRINNSNGYLGLMRGTRANDNSYEWVGFYSGETRQGIILYDGAWGGANGSTDEFSITAENGNKLTLNTNGDHIALMPDGAGNVGIGTLNPTADLEVDGSIVSEEIRIEVVNAPDYVFADDYQLMSLKEVKEYLNAFNHLPEIPSAKEMESDGVELGLMSMRLLKKIEELTLHQIELLEAIEQQKVLIEMLEEKVSKINQDASANH